MRGQQPYLTLSCLQAWAAQFGERLQFCIATRDGKIVAMAFFFEDGDTLYGRHWGSDANYDRLHFELCYSQCIDRCIARPLAHFHAGGQGGHKIARRFEHDLDHSTPRLVTTRLQTATQTDFNNTNT